MNDDPHGLPFVLDGKTGQPIPYNADVPYDIYTAYILTMVSLVGFETTERFLGISLGRETDSGV